MIKSIEQNEGATAGLSSSDAFSGNSSLLDKPAVAHKLAMNLHFVRGSKANVEIEGGRSTT
jgi:hypothetical protein